MVRADGRRGLLLLIVPAEGALQEAPDDGGDGDPDADPGAEGADAGKPQHDVIGHQDRRYFGHHNAHASARITVSLRRLLPDAYTIVRR